MTKKFKNISKYFALGSVCVAATTTVILTSYQNTSIKDFAIERSDQGYLFYKSSTEKSLPSEFDEFVIVSKGGLNLSGITCNVGDSRLNIQQLSSEI
jgi:hypothetical protein